MHWLPIMVIAALTLAAQTVVAPRVEILGARPDLLLILVLFFGLTAPPRRAVLIGWGLGLFADLMSVERFGLLSLTYGLASLGVVSIRDSIAQRGPFAQFALALLLESMIRTGWAIYVSVLYGASAGSVRSGIVAAGYTALLAPMACGVLGRIAPLFGLPRRSTATGRYRMGHAYV